jgi:dipeptidase D
MDMVCEKEAGCVHDFTKDPIKMIYDGDFIHADGTTLGADDGIAVAMALAVLDDDSIAHPAIEAVFTTDEEVGMLGASSLDCNLLEGRIMLNIDSEEEGIFTVGCAGGVKTTTVIPVEFEKNAPFNDFARITIDGLQGGHSGIEINKERGNANKLIAKVIYNISKNADIRLCSIEGGAKDNAIPRLASAVICCEDYRKVENLVADIDKAIKNELAIQDPNVKVSIEKCKESAVMTKESTENITECILLIPNGVLAVNTQLNMPETSNNIGVVRTNENDVEIVCAVRSSVKTKKADVCDAIEMSAKRCGGKVKYRGDYPAWEYNPNSALKDVCIECYKKQYGVEPAVETVHAGLECGLFAEKVPDMDMVSFGPNLYDIHTPKEKASISSIERVWNFVLNVLAELK